MYNIIQKYTETGSEHGVGRSDQTRDTGQVVRATLQRTGGCFGESARSHTVRTTSPIHGLLVSTNCLIFSLLICLIII